MKPEEEVAHRAAATDYEAERRYSGDLCLCIADLEIHRLGGFSDTRAYREGDGTD
jgi:hypothetical protein